MDNMTKLEKKLISIYGKLNLQSQGSLIDFAEFLLSRGSESLADEEPRQNLYSPEAPPANESVIAAIKRLQRSYKMLDTKKLFTEASGLMSAHMMQGREADKVIVDLEALFDKNYQSYLEEQNPGNELKN